MQKRVRVCIRVRPTDNSYATEPLGQVGHNGAVAINEQEQSISVVTNTVSGGGTSFRFDQVLSSAIDQCGVFRSVGAEVVDGALSGYNGCILAYGQTGAGKTFTMSGGGPRRRFEDRGLIARALSRIFQKTQQDAEHSYALRISYLEIYNDRLIDLLSSDAGTPTIGTASNGLVIQENACGQTFVRGLTKALVGNEEQALDLVFQGETNRAVAEHALNATSTRSHCIFTLYLERKRSVMSSEMIEEDGPGDGDLLKEDNVVFSKLHLVDLAGSERMKKTLTEAGSTQANEACFINRSLTFLEQVVLALGSKNRAHVPFRQTPLTNLLKDSLGGNCRTLLVACVWPAPTHADQTLATLRFAARMRRVKTQAVVNVVASGSGAAGSKLASEERAMYRDEIRRLREELVLYDVISGLTRSNHEDKESIQTENLRRQQITTFLADADQVPPVLSFRQVQQLLQTFRLICLEQKETLEPAMNQTRTTGSKMVAQIRALRGHTPPGVRSASAPASNSHDNEDSAGGVVTRLPPLVSGNQVLLRDKEQQRVTPVRAFRETDKELFEQFKAVGGADPGAEALRNLEQTKQNLREAKTQYAALALTVNRVKLEIDECAMYLQELRDRDTPEQQSKEDEVERLNLPLLQLQDAKKRYRIAFDQLQEKKAEITYLAKIKTQMLQQVALQFQAWRDRHETALADEWRPG